ncbi:hypothetical protein DH2020_009598 [Rehmannia glutinosa]|uniref:AB hydrolase-1 domain-containing protein n=1 Tax=Rehmannia glutinosa TaxID=99300 RepID=A0ABR0X9J9_REHGL
MAVTGAGVFAAVISPLIRRRDTSPAAETFRLISKSSKLSVLASVVPTEKQPRQRAQSVSINGVVEEKSTADTVSNSRRGGEWETGSKDGRLTLKDYLEQCREFVSRSDGGPPRWFSPLECGSRLEDSPVLLSLPGIDGVGLGLLLHHERLGEPIYLVGESFGGCLALAVAARNPDIDLVLILANPGAPVKMVGAAMGKRLPLEQVIRELSEETFALSSYLSVLSDILTAETLRWKLDMLKSAAAFANSRLHAVKAQTLILASGQDLLLPSREEAERLRQVLPKCDIRAFDDKGHALFLEDGVNLLSILIGTSFYRRGRRHDYVLDYLPPTFSEFQKVYKPQSGNIVRSLAGIPSEGPVLYVGYHMMLGLELTPLVAHFWTERNILLRGVAHPMMFTKLREGQLPAISAFDTMRVMGAVPVSAANFYRLFSSKSHVLLYPGGMREPFIARMASKFGAKIIPFGSVGEDDIGQLLLDYHDLRNIPYFKNAIEDLTDEAAKLRSEAVGEVANQDVHLPIILPKVPGRFYYLFGKPIETEGRKQELKSREKAHELYLEVKSEVEKCLGYLKEKRESDPYRNIFARLSYQATHGFDSEVPTFDFNEAP